MSKSSNYSGRTIVVDKVVQLAEQEDSGLGYFAQQLEIEAQKLTSKQSEYNNKYSIAVAGRFVATARVPAEITLNIYRNDTKLTSSDAVVFGSSVAYVSEDGTYAEYGEYASHYTRTIPITKLKNLTESIRCVWRGNDSDAIPLVTTFKIDVGEAVQYAYSKYTDEDKVKVQELVWWDTVEDAKSVTSDDLRYLWQRRTSTYDFDTQQYTDWKYYKTDIDYPARSTEDTAKDTIEIITPSKYVNFLSSKNSFTVNRRAKDGDADIVTFSYACSGYKTHEIDTVNPWIATAYKSNGETAQLATGTGQTFSITVLHNAGYSKIVVTATVLTNKGTGLEESHAYSLTLTPIDITLPEKYLGVLSTLPTGGVLPDGSKAEGGDWFVYKDTNVMYVYDSATLSWTAYDSSDSLDTIPLEKVSVALGDMINLGTNDHTTATLMGVFKALCADEGFIKYLQTYSLLVAKENFSFEVSSIDRATGEQLATPLFKVTYDGGTIFQINPTTGNIFFGEPNTSLTEPTSGFMYDATAHTIVSLNNKMEIKADGTLAVVGGRFSGELVATEGTFTGQLDTPSMSALPSDGGMSKRQTVPAYGGTSSSDMFDALWNAFSSFPSNNSGTASVYSGKLKGESSESSWNSGNGMVFSLIDMSSGEKVFEASKVTTGIFTTKITYSIDGTYKDTFKNGFELTLSYGAEEILIFKNLPVGSATGLKSGQVYRDDNYNLKIAP